MMNINTTTGSMARKGVVLSLSVALSALAFGANLSPITPRVDHQKKATCGISWTIQSGGLIKGFEIRRGLTDVYEEADVIAIVDNKTSKLTDWGADRYTDYYYWVVAFDYNDENTTWYGTDGGEGIRDKSRYACKNHRYWSSGDVYLTASVKSISIGSTLPLYFKIDIGTPTEPFYDHMKPDMIEIREMLDNQGRPANDIAYIFSNRDEEYENKAEGVDTYLSASGAFGYLLPMKPGKIRMKAYYKDAQTGADLTIEVKTPTFNLYAPEGNADVVECHMRDLYLKCNGKFVRPDDESFVANWGESVVMYPCTVFETVGGEFENGLYDNAFGFLNVIHGENADTTSFDITYNGIFVKEYQITPTWNRARRLEIFYMDSFGRTVTTFVPNQTYKVGVKYGDKVLPYKYDKCGSSFPAGCWAWEEGLGLELWCVPRNLRSWSGEGEYFPFSYYNPSATSVYGELGEIKTVSTGQLKLTFVVVDHEVTDTIYFER